MGKTTMAVQAATHVWKTLGKKTRVVNADGGGTREGFSGLIEEGIASVWDVDTWDDRSIFENIELATKGYWPEDPATPNSRLLEPTRDWRECPTCLKDSGGKSLTMPPKCASCGVAFAAGQLLPVRRELTNGMQDIGLVVFEGMTSFGERFLDRLKKIDSGGGNSINDPLGQYKISNSGQAHYLMAQRAISSAVTNVRQIPVDMVLWTALEIRADDDGKPLYGPQGPGKKLTSLCIPWFTAVLHLDGVAQRDPKSGMVVKDKAGMEVLERKLFLAPHFPADSPTSRFAAKCSVPFGGDMPTVIDPDMGLFFSELAKAKARAKAKLLGQ